MAHECHHECHDKKQRVTGLSCIVWTDTTNRFFCFSETSVVKLSSCFYLNRIQQHRDLAVWSRACQPGNISPFSWILGDSGLSQQHSWDDMYVMWLCNISWQLSHTEGRHIPSPVFDATSPLYTCRTARYLNLLPLAASLASCREKNKPGRCWLTARRKLNNPSSQWGFQCAQIHTFATFAAYLQETVTSVGETSGCHCIWTFLYLKRMRIFCLCQHFKLRQWSQWGLFMPWTCRKRLCCKGVNTTEVAVCYCERLLEELRVQTAASFTWWAAQAGRFDWVPACAHASSPSELNLANKLLKECCLYSSVIHSSPL